MYKCEKCGTTSMMPAKCPMCGVDMTEMKVVPGQAGDVKPADNMPPKAPPAPPAAPMPPAGA